MLAAIIWLIVFGISLTALVKGADWLLRSAERVGLASGLSPFVVGIIIVGAGTSFPELVSSVAAVWKGASEIVAANAIGSNVANILLVVGTSAVVGRRLVVEKDLINLDLPLLAISTVLFLGIVYDGYVSFIEALLLLAGYGIYLAYTISYKDQKDEDRLLPALESRRRKRRRSRRPKLVPRDFIMLVAGTTGLLLGAKYMIDAVVSLSEIFAIGAGAIAIIAVAIGTSLPELIVSLKAAHANKSELALGNIFGSNAFNMLVVVGLPGVLGRLELDEKTLTVGLPTMLLATFLFVVSGISRRIHIWEGGLYLLLYVLFTGKIFGLF